MKLAPNLKQARAEANRQAIDAGTQPGAILCYTAPQPATGEEATGMLLVSIPLTYPCGVADTGGLTITASAPGQALTDGNINWARIVDSTGKFVMDGTVRRPSDPDAATADFIIDITGVLTGAFVLLMSAYIAEGG